MGMMANAKGGEGHRLLHASMEKQAKSLKRCLLGLHRNEISFAGADDIEETTKNLEIFLSHFDEDEDGELNIREGWNILTAYFRLRIFRYMRTQRRSDNGSFCDTLIIDELGKLGDYLDAHHLTMVHFGRFGSWCEKEAPIWLAHINSVKELSLGVVTVDLSKVSGIYDKFGIEEIPSTVLVTKGISYNIYKSYSVFRYEGKCTNYSPEAIAHGNLCTLEVCTHLHLYMMYVCMIIFIRRFERSVRNVLN